MNDETVTFMVILKNRDADSDPKGLGARAFRVAPRVGEYIRDDNPDDVSLVYRVRAVIHPLQLATYAGDLIVESVGDEVDLLRSF